ncbi:MAG TPA: molybdopterin cofactor-binding domain-containing protein [Candidatus Dormibacteraeota bacterium]
MAVTAMIGAKIHRREDPRLVSGAGHYVDDFTLPGTAYMSIVRSPYAHARINSIDVTAASKAPGVVAIYTYKDFAKAITGGIPVAPAFVAEKKQTPNRFPIAEKEVVYQGEAVAVVLADSRYQAVDAANLVDVNYDQLPAVMDMEKALDPKSPKVHSDGPDNVAWDLTYVPDDAEAMKEADVVIKERIHQQRLSPTAIEPRGVMAEYARADGSLTVWMSTQIPHLMRFYLTLGLGLPESRIRVVSQDVGGGFGSKGYPQAEDYLVTAAAKLSSRPVKWIEGRTEAIQGTPHGRGQFFDVEAGAKKDGTLVALKVTQYLDAGGYVGNLGAFQGVACLLSGGAYKWKHISARTVGVLTNRVPTDIYRGAGRPEATHLCERVIDLLAGALKMDPVAIRRKNFATEFPFTNNFGLVYDSGAYEKALDKALEMVGYDRFRKEQEEGRRKGKYLGIGLSSWIEICGIGPSAPTAGATGGIALVESAQVRVFPTGSVSVYVGTHSHGQSHETTFPQIVADTLGVPYDSIELRHGDTAEGPAFGYGTYGSRSLAVGGMAVHKASKKVVDKARKLAAHIFEASEDDVVFDQGQFYVKGSPDKRKAMAEIALASYGASLPPDMEQGLEAVAYFDPPNFVWPFGTHIAVVEVDPETGDVDLQRYIAVDDCGNVINPMIVDGQIHGGVTQGIAQALYEEVVYDNDSGQMRTGTMTDYLIPTANEIPNLELDRTVTPSPTNELGVKGIGEAGTIASSAAVINAVCDALSPFGIKHVDMPASPDRIWKQIQQARVASSNGEEARK